MMEYNWTRYNFKKLTIFFLINRESSSLPSLEISLSERFVQKNRKYGWSNGRCIASLMQSEVSPYIIITFD